LYTDYFKFDELPFSIAPDPRFLYRSPRHQEGLAHLLYGINTGGGFIALTGEVGTGKTTLCHCLLKQLPDNIELALILNPKLNSLELLASICDELRITYSKTEQSLKILVDALNQHLIGAHRRGKRTVLMIDEAQNLSDDVLEQIRLLTNLETSKTKLLQIILVGQPELKQLLNSKKLRQLNQRITARYHLEALSSAETQTYIQHRLSVCGGNPTLFNKAAIRRIYQLSEGIPRLINILCDRALLGAYASHVYLVDKKIVNKAAQEVLPEIEARSFSLMSFLFSLIIISSLLAASFYWLQTKPVAIITKPINKPATKFTPILSWLNNAFSLENRLKANLQLWAIKPPKNINCQQLKELACFQEQSHWDELLDLKRPAILELLVNNTEKTYVLLIGVSADLQQLYFDDGYSFSRQQLQDYWQGYYLVLWKPPFPNQKTLYPQQQSPQISWLRQQFSNIDGKALELNPSELFDIPLENRVKDFQQQQHLKEDGIVGSRTLIHLQNFLKDTKFPRLKRME